MSTHWNHRVMKFTKNGETWYAVHEVHYEGDKPMSYSAQPAVILAGDGTDDHGGINGLRWTLGVMEACLLKPILTPEDFDSETN